MTKQTTTRTDDPMQPPEQAYRHQEIIQAATSMLQEIVLDANHTAQVKDSATESATESFIDHCDRLMGILADAYYAIQDGRLYTPDSGERKMLLGASQSLWWEAKGQIPDDRRHRLRKTVSDAVQWVLSWQGTYDPMQPPEQAYHHQEIVLDANHSANADPLPSGDDTGPKIEIDPAHFNITKKPYRLLVQLVAGGKVNLSLYKCTKRDADELKAKLRRKKIPRYAEIADAITRKKYIASINEKVRVRIVWK